MSIDQHYRSLENMYASTPNNKYYNPDLRVSEGKAVLKLNVRADFFHSIGRVDGSVYYKMLDDCCFYASNSLCDEMTVITSSFNLHLLKPVSDGVLVAEARVVHRTKSIIITEGVIRDKHEVDVARGTGTFVISKIPLDESIGYSY